MLEILFKNLPAKYQREIGKKWKKKNPIDTDYFSTELKENIREFLKNQFIQPESIEYLIGDRGEFLTFKGSLDGIAFINDDYLNVDEKNEIIHLAEEIGLENLKIKKDTTRKKPYVPYRQANVNLVERNDANCIVDCINYILSTYFPDSLKFHWDTDEYILIFTSPIEKQFPIQGDDSILFYDWILNQDEFEHRLWDEDDSNIPTDIDDIRDLLFDVYELEVEEKIHEYVSSASAFVNKVRNEALSYAKKQYEFHRNNLDNVFDFLWDFTVFIDKKKNQLHLEDEFSIPCNVEELMIETVKILNPNQDSPLYLTLWDKSRKNNKEFRKIKVLYFRKIDEEYEFKEVDAKLPERIPIEKIDLFSIKGCDC